MVIGVSKDENIPLEVRSGLVGLIVPTIFTKESIEKQTGLTLPIPENSRLAYCVDVVEVLKSAGKHKEAEQLKSCVSNPLDMYVLEPEIFEPLDRHSMDDFRGGKHPFKKDCGFVHPDRKD